MNETKRYYFDNNGVTLETVHQSKVALTNEILQELQSSAYNVILNISDVKENIALATGKKYTFICMEIPEIRMNTYYQPYSGSMPIFGRAKNTSPAMNPCWNPTDKAIKKDFTWTPPEYMKIYFIVRYTLYSSLNEPHWAVNECLLISKIDEDIYRPPVPNVYANGNMCMGSGYSHPYEGNIFKQFEYCLNHFKESSWNSDLSEGQCKNIIFNTDGEAIHPTKPRYKTDLDIISNAQLVWIPQIERK